MKTLTSYFPTSFNNYHEPFLGGMSVFMELYNKGFLWDKSVYLSDFSTSLINLYNVIKNNFVSLKKEFQTKDYQNDKDFFLTTRKKFNTLKKKPDLSVNESVELAAIFLYLNKTCFNGMYRENKNGEYNVPFGKQSGHDIFNESIVANLHIVLNQKNIYLSCGNYDNTFSKASSDDFFYLDPPYYDTFTCYLKESFGKNEQIQLKKYFQLLSEKGCKVALSNSNTEFIKQLYKDIPGINIYTIPVKRVIRKCSTNSELLITNY
jgi:DNA adenine methylase